MDRCIDHHDITVILLKMALNTNQLIFSKEKNKSLLKYNLAPIDYKFYPCYKSACLGYPVDLNHHVRIIKSWLYLSIWVDG